MNRETYYTLLGLGKAAGSAPILYVPINFVYNTAGPYTGFGSLAGAQGTTNTSYFTFYYAGGAFNTGTVVYESATGANTGVNPNTGTSHWYQTYSGSFYLIPNGNGTYTVNNFVAGVPSTPAATCVNFTFNSNQGYSGTASWLDCITGQTQTRFMNQNETHTVCARVGSPQGMPFTSNASCSGSTNIQTYGRSQTFYSNSCGARRYGTAYTYTKFYTSIYSYEDALAGALKDTLYLADGQAYTNSNGTCGLYNIVIPNVLTITEDSWRLFEKNPVTLAIKEMTYLDYPAMSVVVNNLSGQNVFSVTNYTPWDFRYNASGGVAWLPNGNYNYVINLNDGSGRTFSGQLQLTYPL